jgi:cell shape-determining protein MreC
MKNFSPKMKGSSLLNSKERPFRTYIRWLLLVFLVLFLGKDMLGSISGVIASPFYTIRHYFETSEAALPAFVRSRTELLTQIQTLQEEIAGNTGADATLAYLMEENAELKALLAASTSPRILAGVIGRPPFTPYDTLIVDRGSLDGVVPYAPVFHGNGVAIGYVRSVFEKHAFVTLFSSPNVESTVYVFGPNLFTTGHGQGGGVIRLSVPQGVVIEKGNAVVLPSLDTGVLGTVDAVESNPTEPEQHAYVTLDVPIQSMRLLSIGTRPIESASFEEAVESVREEEKRFKIEIPEGAPAVFNEASSTPVNNGTNTTPL